MNKTDELTLELARCIRAILQNAIEEAVGKAMGMDLNSAPNAGPPQLCMSTIETAKTLGFSTKTLLRLVERGHIKPMPDSTRRFIFSRTEIERYVADAGTRSVGKKKYRAPDHRPHSKRTTPPRSL